MATKVRALLDYGTNSLKLVVCSLKHGKLETLLDTERITRLGQNIMVDGLLTQLDVDHILQATAELLEEANPYKPDSIDAYGTAALRRCLNRDLLTDPLYEQYDLRLKLLSGTEEAVVGYLGVRSDFDGTEPLATLDLGGGSTELTLGQGVVPDHSISLSVGARGLLKKVPISDPPSYEEIDAIRREVRSHLQDVALLPTGTHLVLIGGAATTLAGYAKHLWQAPGDTVADTLTPEALDLLTMKLGRKTLQERRALPGSTKADRSDVIVHGVVALREMLGALGVDTAWVSLRSLPHGLFHAEQYGIHPDQDPAPLTLPDVDFPPFNRPDRSGEVVFLLRRPDGRFWLQTKLEYADGVYRLPGGGVHHGEDPVDAVVREVQEETGLQQPRPLPISRLTYAGPDGKVLDWYTDLYLVNMPDDSEPVPEDLSEGISGWLAAGPDELQQHLAHLENLEPSRHAWGLFRADAIRYLMKRLAEDRF